MLKQRQTTDTQGWCPSMYEVVVGHTDRQTGQCGLTLKASQAQRTIGHKMTMKAKHHTAYRSHGQAGRGGSHMLWVGRRLKGARRVVIREPLQGRVILLASRSLTTLESPQQGYHATRCIAWPHRPMRDFYGGLACQHGCASMESSWRQYSMACAERRASARKAGYRNFDWCCKRPLRPAGLICAAGSRNPC